MKRFLRVLPLAFYPYAYLVVILVIVVTNGSDKQDLVEDIMLYLALIYNAYVLIYVIINSFVTASKKYNIKTVAAMNLFVKGIQIPAYIFHFIMGMCGMMMSVWGLGFIAFAIIIDLITIILTGINSIGCTVKMCREGAINKRQAFFMGIGCFIYCIDVVIAVIYFIKAFALSKKQQGL